MANLFRYVALIILSATLSGCLRVAGPDAIGIREAARALPPVEREIRLVSWNIAKEDAAHPQFRNFFREYAPDIYCLQEATGLTCGQFGRADFNCCFAPSWKGAHWDGFTGVLTLSRFGMECPEKVLSPDKEFLFLTPKAALVSTLELPDGRELVIVNVHILTFSCLRYVRRQYERIYEAVRFHRGPMIVCGDFNTWNGSRIKAAQQFAARLGLVEALACHDSPAGTPTDWFIFLKPFISIDLDATLDRIFFRGLEVIEFERLPEFSISDHPPLLFRARLLNRNS